MKISIIDIGTQSLKHYVFDVGNNKKEKLYYKRYSELNLGEGDDITPEAAERCLMILQNCLKVNKDFEVEQLKIVGTEIFRKAKNAKELCLEIQKLTGSEIEIISHEKEALYLYEGFINIVPENFLFGATNIGGGSTEVVVGNKKDLLEAHKIPFGAKFLRKSFSNGEELDWRAIDEYLDKNISIDQKVETVFVTGVLDFVSTVGPHLGFEFEENDLPNHPIKLTLEKYIHFLNILRETPIEKLKELYTKDSNFAYNFAIGQSVYVAASRKLGAKTIIPSNNDLTDGLIYEMLN